MADCPDPDKKLVGLRVPRDTWRRLQILSEKSNKTANSIAVTFLVSATEHVTLTPEDYEQIAHDTREAIKRNKAR